MLWDFLFENRLYISISSGLIIIEYGGYTCCLTFTWACYSWALSPVTLHTAQEFWKMILWTIKYFYYIRKKRYSCCIDNWHTRKSQRISPEYQYVYSYGRYIYYCTVERRKIMKRKKLPSREYNLCYHMYKRENKRIR